MRPFAEKFYASAAWKKTRAAYLQSVGGLCERCELRGLIEVATIVHHKVYLTEQNINDLEAALSWRNLEALCSECHNREHHGGEDEKCYSFAPDGSLRKRPPVQKIGRGGFNTGRGV